MAVPSGHTPWSDWCLWRDLVSTGPRNRTYEAARVVHRLHRHILLGTLWRPDQTPFRAAWSDTQLRAGQLNYFDPVVTPYIGFRENFRTTSRRGAGKLGFDRLGRLLYNAGARIVLHRNSRNRRGARANTPTPLPGLGNGSLRMDFW